MAHTYEVPGMPGMYITEGNGGGIDRITGIAGEPGVYQLLRVPEPQGDSPDCWALLRMDARDYQDARRLEVVDEYERGTPVGDIAAAYGVTRARIYKILEVEGVYTPERRMPDTPDVAEHRELYAEAGRI